MKIIALTFVFLINLKGRFNMSNYTTNVGTAARRLAENTSKELFGVTAGFGFWGDKLESFMYLFNGNDLAYLEPMIMKNVEPKSAYAINNALKKQTYDLMIHYGNYIKDNNLKEFIICTESIKALNGELIKAYAKINKVKPDAVNTEEVPYYVDLNNFKLFVLAYADIKSKAIRLTHKVDSNTDMDDDISDSFTF